MRTATVLALLALIVGLPATSMASDQKEIKEKRVVRVVAPPDFDYNFETNEDFIFVGDGNDTVQMGAFAFHRGGFIGVQLVDLTPDLRAHFGVPESAGVMVSGVSEDGPAAAAGLLVGDIIAAINGEEIGGAGELARLVRQAEEGDLANLEVWRDGKVMTLTATIAEHDRPQVDVGQFLWQSGNGDDQRVVVHIDDLPENVIRIDQKHMHKALGDLYTHFQSPEWQAKIKAMATERQGMEERIHELEGRLRELEEKLSKLAK